MFKNIIHHFNDIKFYGLGIRFKSIKVSSNLYFKWDLHEFNY
jgi:hypothetical protein